MRAAYSGAFAVDLDELLAVVGDLERCGSTLDDLLDDLSHRIRLLHLTWTGDAAAAQAGAQQAWESGFRDMLRALAAMRSAAQVAHANYSSGAATNLRMWERVR